jgi:hypothetical protein
MFETYNLISVMRRDRSRMGPNAESDITKLKQFIMKTYKFSFTSTKRIFPDSDNTNPSKRHRGRKGGEAHDGAGDGHVESAFDFWGVAEEMAEAGYVLQPDRKDNWEVLHMEVLHMVIGQTISASTY